MGMSVQELKHAARLQEWSARVAECRSSGIGVKAWCAEHSIALKTYYNWEKQIVKAATQKYALPAPAQAGANASVIVFSVLETAKANGLNPEAYLKHLLSVLPERFAADPQATVEDLMPWAEEIRVMFGESCAEH